MNTYSNETQHTNTNMEEFKLGNATYIPIKAIPINPIKGLFIIEDGSVDIDFLDDVLFGTGIKVLLYRSGSQKPELIRLDK